MNQKHKLFRNRNDCMRMWFIIINLFMVFGAKSENLERHSEADIILNKKPVSSSHDLLQLRKTLLNFYDRKSRPIKNSSLPIQVQIGISVSQINRLDEVYQVFFKII